MQVKAIPHSFLVHAEAIDIYYRGKKTRLTGAEANALKQELEQAKAEYLDRLDAIVRTHKQAHEQNSQLVA